jgi:FtsZ-binding cell division protein ZapB
MAIIRETTAAQDRHIAGVINRAWRKHMLGKPDKNDLLPASPPARLSHHAANVAAHVEQLEIDLNTLRVELNDARNDHKVAQGRVDDLARENTHLLNERDNLKGQLYALLTRLSDARDLIDKCLSVTPPAQADSTPLSPEKVEPQLEEALKA